MAVELRPPKRKRRVFATLQQPFPVLISNLSGISANNSLWQLYTGTFNGDCVVVETPSEMAALYNMGFFGKGSLSHSAPEFGRERYGIPPFLKRRQWEQRAKWFSTIADQEENGKTEIKTEGTEDESGDGDGSGDESEQKDEVEVKEESASKRIKLENAEEESQKEETAAQAVKVENINEETTEDKTTTKIVKVEEEEGEERTVDENAREEKHSTEETVPNSEISQEKSIACNSDTTAGEVKQETSLLSDSVGESGVEEQNEEVVSDDEKSSESKHTVKIEENDKEMDIIDVEDDDEKRKSKEQRGEAEIDVIRLEESDDSSDINVIDIAGDSVCEKDVESVCDKDVESRTVKTDTRNRASTSGRDDSVSQIGRRDRIGPLSKYVVVLTDSDSEDEEFLTRLNPKLHRNRFRITEGLHLTLEEAYFLSFGLGCLQVSDLLGNLLSLIKMWKLFCETQRDFVQKYVAYHYFRSKGWIVKPGCKFGGDFLLYKQGPPFYHASYVVLVEVIDDNSQSRCPNRSSWKLTWTSLMGLNRVAESSGKEVLLCQVVWPADVPQNEAVSPECISKFTVQEVLVRRWISSQEREEREKDEIE